MNNNTSKTSFRNLYAFGKKLPIDLSLSENPLGCSPKVSIVLNQLTRADFFDYPDPDSSILRKAISKRFQIETENVFVANGSEAIIKLLPQILLKENAEIIIPKVTFPMFEIATRLARNKVVFSEMTKDFDIDLADIKSRVTSKTSLIFLCNPNNPTGRVLQRRDILDLVRSTKALVLVDEANIEFGGETVIKDTKQFSNLIILRTFSKGFGLAGFRVGFCVADKKVIQGLKQVSQPFPVSSIAQKVAVAALQDSNFIIKTRLFMKREREFLVKELVKRGFDVIESEANNLLIRVNGKSSSLTGLISKLNRKGVSVVSGSSFNSLGNEFIRVSPRLRQVNKQFIQAIDEIIG